MGRDGELPSAFALAALLEARPRRPARDRARSEGSAVWAATAFAPNHLLEEVARVALGRKLQPHILHRSEFAKHLPLLDISESDKLGWFLQARSSLARSAPGRILSQISPTKA
jgi:hypothetical protein